MGSGANRVKRGGSWNNRPHNVRSANRNRNRPDRTNNNIGFRLASPPVCDCPRVTIIRLGTV
ncbi:MAG: SUMF1/EgtB/PvdO family nonheme iron enzyme [Gammaproteobacteria bacterium]|nr:SUMF1/EgtB/PvdO family nonheme iron enzyme [Gammaproteobacteria bacterium]